MSDMSIEQRFAERKGIFEVDLNILHHFSDGLYAKEMTLPVGYEACTHSHVFSHLSILAKGRVIVETDNTMQEFNAPACIEIKAHTRHRIEALEDSKWFCIHATEETDVSKVDEVLIKGE